MTISEILDYSLLNLDDYSLKLFTVVLFTIFWLVVFALLFLVKKLIYRSKKIDYAKKFSVYALIKYFVWVFSFIIAMQILGFNLSVLLAGSAALLVGLGLGMQNLFSDFTSGIILLFDATIKVGDVIEVNGMIAKVQGINLRTTTVLTRDDNYIILPNSQLTGNQIVNWTHSEISSRFAVQLGVDYSSDVSLVIHLMMKAMHENKDVLKTPAPSVQFVNYGASSLDFTAYFWSEEVFRVEKIKSDLRIRIFELLNQNGVSIPFPQRVVHMKTIPS